MGRTREIEKKNKQQTDKNGDMYTLVSYLTTDLLLVNLQGIAIGHLELRSNLSVSIRIKV